ncbi:hypothetical protein ACFQV2_03450 [Actinokineospora soli]|uniref:Uncharacterized protein n=1 Tax=Actinokineospora soli TaxID=1048753 RepID=A0ABW2TGQ9_9PSEU
MSGYRKILPWSRFRPVMGPLPVESWFRVPGLLRFGCPWPWQVAESSSLLHPDGDHDDTAVLATLEAPRSHGRARLLVWLEPNPVDLTRDPAPGLEQLYQGRAVETRAVLLDGRRAVAVEVDAPGARRVARLVADSGRGDPVHAELDVPRASAQGYRPHWDTMLATWQWL